MTTSRGEGEAYIADSHLIITLISEDNGYFYSQIWGKLGLPLLYSPCTHSPHLSLPPPCCPCVSSCLSDPPPLLPLPRRPRLVRQPRPAAQFTADDDKRRADRPSDDTTTRGRRGPPRRPARYPPPLLTVYPHDDDGPGGTGHPGGPDDTTPVIRTPVTGR